MKSSYGYSVMPCQAGTMQKSSEAIAEEMAERAFLAGHECRFRGPNASIYLAGVPRHLECFARCHYKKLIKESKMPNTQPDPKLQELCQQLLVAKKDTDKALDDMKKTVSKLHPLAVELEDLADSDQA